MYSSSEFLWVSDSQGQSVDWFLCGACFSRGHFKTDLQSCEKYIGNLLNFTGNLNLKKKFKVAFWLFLKRQLQNLILLWEDWLPGCSLSISFPFTQIPKFPKILSLKSQGWQSFEAIVVSFLLHIPLMCCLWLQLLLNLHNFSHMFCMIVWKVFFLTFWGFQALNIVQMITLQKQNKVPVDILAFTFVWIKLNPHFLPNSLHGKPCFNENLDLK